MRYNYSFADYLCKLIANVMPPRSNKKKVNSISQLLPFHFSITELDSGFTNWYMPVIDVGLAASLLQHEEKGLLCN